MEIFMSIFGKLCVNQDNKAFEDDYIFERESGQNFGVGSRGCARKNPRHDVTLSTFPPLHLPVGDGCLELEYVVDVETSDLQIFRLIPLFLLSCSSSTIAWNGFVIFISVSFEEYQF